MAAWARDIRHPWFNPPTVKRKLSTSDDDDMPPATFSTSRRKRVRYNSLERTLAHMTLGSALEDVDMPKISPSRLCQPEPLDVMLPSSVEEPDTPVDMEVEPTLTSSAPPWDSGQLDIKEVQISPAVLECLRRQTRRPAAPIPLSSQPSQALVLYRAPRPPSPKPLEQACNLQEEPTRTSSLAAHEDDVMEVE